MFIEDREVTFSDSDNKRINKLVTKFVDEMFESVGYYSRMRNVSKDRAKVDMFVGKKAEFFTAQLLNDMYLCESKLIPDMQIYKGRNKSWDADLKWGSGLGVHVKSCTASTYKYIGDYSWTFQYSDNKGDHGKDYIFDQENEDLLSLVYIDSPKSETAIIKGIVKLKDIKHLLKDPKKQLLVGLKKCLYYQDLL